MLIITYQMQLCVLFVMWQLALAPPWRQNLQDRIRKPRRFSKQLINYTIYDVTFLCCSYIVWLEICNNLRVGSHLFCSINVKRQTHLHLRLRQKFSPIYKLQVKSEVFNWLKIPRQNIKNYKNHLKNAFWSLLATLIFIVTSSELCKSGF